MHRVSQNYNYIRGNFATLESSHSGTALFLCTAVWPRGYIMFSASVPYGTPRLKGQPVRRRVGSEINYPNFTFNPGEVLESEKGVHRALRAAMSLNASDWRRITRQSNMVAWHEDTWKIRLALARASSRLLDSPGNWVFQQKDHGSPTVFSDFFLHLFNFLKENLWKILSCCYASGTNLQNSSENFWKYMGSPKGIWTGPAIKKPS